MTMLNMKNYIIVSLYYLFNVFYYFYYIELDDLVSYINNMNLN